MTQLARQIAPLALALLLAACAASPEARLLLLGETRALDEAALGAPAAPLLGRGATVVLALADSGGAEDFARQLESAGLLRGGQIAADAIGVYVSMDPRYSELRAGARWRPYLSSSALERIRAEALGPALRAGEVSAGFAAALAAAEAEIARQQGYERNIRWGVYGALAALLLGLLGAAQHDSLRRSPPGRLLAWVWARTPPGRAARRDLLRALGGERARVDRLDRQVRERLAQLDSPRDAMETLAELAARRAALAHSEDLGELRSLRAAYESWAADVDELLGTRAMTRARAEAARAQVERLRVDMARPARSTRSQRRRKPPRPIGADERARLAAIEARLAELDGSAAELGRLWHSAQDRQVWLHQLGAGYRALEAEALALWREACPAAYAADAARRRSAAALPGSLGGAGPAYSPPAPGGDSSSSSDWPSDYGGGESRAGGDW